MASFDVEDVLSKLTVGEKASLIGGYDGFHTTPLPSYGVPKLRMSDGPNGVRGMTSPDGPGSACFPCGTALGSTFDRELLEAMGNAMGAEAKAKGVHVILGPTVNIQRSPLGGRGFESFSEDPCLSGLSAAAVIRGVQKHGVAATLKHFVCNDQEDDRHGVNVVLSQRALREIYLMPFQLAVRDSNPRAFMTAYGKVNGLHASQNPFLLREVLRGDWKYDGLIISDWVGVYSTRESMMAGLDLEMPGKPVWRSNGLVSASLWARSIDIKCLDELAKNVLNFVKRVATESGIPSDAPSDGDINCPETSQLMRTLAADSCVLLKNDKETLPFRKDRVTAVIGSHSKVACICGGGSASLPPYYTVTPFDGISSKTAKEPLYAFGVSPAKNVPLLSEICTTKDGKKGISATVFDNPRNDSNRKQLKTFSHLSSTEMKLPEYMGENETDPVYYVDFEGYITPEKDAVYDFSLITVGSAKLYVDDELVVDNETFQEASGYYFGYGCKEEIASKALKSGHTYRINVYYGGAATSPIATEESIKAVGIARIGGYRQGDTELGIQQAAEVAKNVDQVVVVVGLNSEWESEGYDREVMDLPPNIDNLVNAILKVNSNVVVVIQSGTPVTLPWSDDAPAILQAWYGGNETGNGIADIIFGDVNPSGKLSLSYPKRVQDNPAFLTFSSDHGTTIYGENVYTGYRYYEAKQLETLFPFGHGLSYTKFEYRNLTVEIIDENLTAGLDICNEGKFDGKESVQFYVYQARPNTDRPIKELKGFSKAFVKAGETKRVTVDIPVKYATSYWHEAAQSWVSEADTYMLFAASSSQDIRLEAQFQIAKTTFWKGL